MKSNSRITALGVALILSVCTAGLLARPPEPSAASKSPAPRRTLRVGLYPFVPQKAELFLKVLREYHPADANVQIELVDIGIEYYGGDLVKALTGDEKTAPVDVAEVDTIFLRDFAGTLIDELPKALLSEHAAYLPLAASAVTLDGKLYGVPHWVCGDFVFFRRDDPDAAKFEKAKSLKDLEAIIGQPSSESDGVMTELKGKSVLGEMYLHSLLDEYQTPEEALKHIQPIDQAAVDAIQRLCALCPGALDHALKFHYFGQYYARQFAHRKTRAFIGYSEGLYDVENEYLHGTGLHESVVGEIYKFDPATNDYLPFSANDIKAIAAPISDKGEKMLGWVDALCTRKGLSAQKQKDALDFIRFYTAEDFNRQLLIPGAGDGPRYLLPARVSLYTDPKILVMAPLYPTFLDIMKGSVSITGPNLNDMLRSIGKEIDKKLPNPP